MAMTAPDAEIPIPPDSIQASKDATRDSSPAQDILEDLSETRDITIIPPCILNCLHPQVLQNGCAHKDYFCFCNQMNVVLLEPAVQSCLKQCPFLGEQLYAQGSIMDFCEVDGIQLEFPPFISQYAVMHRRAFSSSIFSELPQFTPLTTITSTLPWGYAAYTYTQPEGEDGTATVVFAAADTSVSTTFIVTTTVPSGDVGYTSTFTDQKSAAITRVIGVTKAGSAATTSTSPASPNTPVNPDNPVTTPAQSSGGLSSGAKIGLGVAVPLVLILLGLAILLYLRRRKNNGASSQPHLEQETHDGGLPEPMSTIPQLAYPKATNANPPSHPGGVSSHLHVEAGGVPLHELNAGNQRYEAPSNHSYASHEMNPSQQRYEANSNPLYPSHELTADYPHHRSPSPSSPRFPTPTRKPVPVSAANTSSFPPPWDSSGASESEQRRNTGPSPEATAEDTEVVRLEEEMERVKQRVQELKALEAREEELKRSILEKKKDAGSKG